jgi:hypothetical protein
LAIEVYRVSLAGLEYEGVGSVSAKDRALVLFKKSISG